MAISKILKETDTSIYLLYINIRFKYILVFSFILQFFNISIECQTYYSLSSSPLACIYFTSCLFLPLRRVYIASSEEAH